jgi:hypothetical protein
MLSAYRLDGALGTAPPYRMELSAAGCAVLAHFRSSVPETVAQRQPLSRSATRCLFL